MRRFAVPFAVALLIFASPPASASTIVLDSFADVLPPNVCLEATGPRLVYWGPFCEIPPCPPGIPVTGCGGFWAEQSGLPGVLHGVTRQLSIGSSDVDRSSVASIPAAGGGVELSFDDPSGGAHLLVKYSRPGWNLPLVSLTAVGFRTTVAGDLGPGRSLGLSIVLLDHDAELGGSASIAVDAPGEVVVPLSAFEFDEGFDLDSVDEVQIFIGECGAEPCPTDYPPRSLTLGPLQIDVAGTTHNARGTWGALKFRYR